MGVGIIALLALCTYVAIDKIKGYTQNEELRENAIREEDAIYYDSTGCARTANTSIKVYRSENEVGDVVYRSMSTRQVVYNETKAKTAQKRQQAINEGKAYYRDIRPMWDGSYCVEIATDQVYTLEQRSGKYFYRYNHYYEDDILGRPKLRRSFKGIPISKEEYVRLGGYVIGE